MHKLIMIRQVYSICSRRAHDPRRVFFRYRERFEHILPRSKRFKGPAGSPFLNSYWTKSSAYHLCRRQLVGRKNREIMVLGSSLQRSQSYLQMDTLMPLNVATAIYCLGYGDAARSEWHRLSPLETQKLTVRLTSFGI